MSTTYYLTTGSEIPFAVWFSTIPPPSEVGNIQHEPFVVSISAADIGQHVIDLYSQNSNSEVYQTPQNKWSTLVPQWRFTDVNGTVITQITTIDTPIYSGTNVVGTTGYAEFYYIDNVASELGYPTVLWATMSLSGLPLLSESKNETIDIPSYSNSKVIACIPYYVNGQSPHELHITRNGVIPLSTSTYWINQNIPNIISIHGDDYTQFGCTSPSGFNMLFDCPSSNQLGIDLGAISKEIITIPLSAQTWSSLDNGTPDSYLQRYDSNGFNIGGYVRNTVISNTTSLNAVITASANVSYKTYRDTPFVWISNPEENKLHKIYSPYVDNSIVAGITSWMSGYDDGTTVYFNTTALTQKFDIMSLTGFGGIYGMVIDPCYNIWCSDAEQDKIFKFNYNGELILTIDTSDTGITNLRGGCTPAGLSLDYDNNLWVAFFDAPAVLKFDGMTGELLASVGIQDLFHIDLSNSQIFDGAVISTDTYLTLNPNNSALGIPLYTILSQTNTESITSNDINANVIQGQTYGGSYLTININNSSLAIPIYSYSNVDSTFPVNDTFTWTYDNTPVSATNTNANTYAGNVNGTGMYLTLNANSSAFSLPLYQLPIDARTIDIDPVYKPTLVETDCDNNVWVSYTNTLCSCVYKYDTNGLLLTTISLPDCSNPMDMCFDNDQNLWVTLTYHSYYAPITGNVIKIDTNTNTIALNLNTYTHPEYIAVDTENNVWFSYGFNSVEKVGTNGTPLATFTLGVSTEPNIYDIQNYNEIEGLAADSSGRIWAINSMENAIFVLSGTTLINTITTLEFGKFTQRLDNNLNQITALDIYSKSLQAFGDWTGYKWLNKYTVENVFLTGESSPFDIDNFNGYDLRKFNESFDITAQIRSYALPEYVYNNTNLFENYLGTMVGGLETSANSIGKAIYERTANFVQNNVDVDECNINQLYSIAQSLDVPIDDYNIHIPAELKRIMDIVSINHKVLWGDRCKCNYNFREGFSLCNNCGHEHNTNRGDSIDGSTYTVSADVPILAEYKFNRNTYEKIVPVETNTLYNYVSTYLLNDPMDYCYYEFIPELCNHQSEGVINWDDEYTTIDESVSGLNAWYGSNEMVEKMINYYLHKGLGF